MRGNYIGKKPVQYDSITSTKPGVWEIYDQGQLTRDGQWTGQPWDLTGGVYANKKSTVSITEALSHDVQFKNDGTKFYILGNTNDSIYQYSCSTAWDVNTVSYDNKLLSITARDTNPTGLFFKNDGTKLYIVGTTNRTIYQYSLSTAWDISTAIYESKLFSVNAQETSPNGLFFKDDGTKFYVVGSTSDTVFQYSCSTAWDVSTASYDSKSFSVTSQENTPTGLFFKDDGTKFYIFGTQNDRVYQYSCSTAWDVSTGAYETKTAYVGFQEITPNGFCFKSDGAKFYAVGQGSNKVFEYALSTPWDVSTNNGASGTANVGQETSTQDVQFKSDGTKFYTIGRTNKTIYQYSCQTAWDVGNATYDSKSFSVNAQESLPNGFCFKTDGTKFYVLGQNSDTVFQYSCSTAWDISTSSYDSKSFGIGGQDAISTGIFFKPDGTKFYISGSLSGRLYQYSCATAWDISTSSYDSKSYVNSANALFFKSDGTKVYAANAFSISQSTLSTAWDISTATLDTQVLGGAATGIFLKDDGTKIFTTSTANTVVPYDLPLAWDLANGGNSAKGMRITLQDTTPTGIFFKDDGLKFFIIGQTADRIHQYICTIPWDVTTSSYNYQADGVYSSYPLAEVASHGLFFKPDGTAFYVVGTTSDTVFQYSCPTAWDVSTASYTGKSFSVSSQENGPNGVFFKSDGTKFYIVGSTNDTVYQYSLSTAWDISTASYDSKSFSIAGQEGSPTGLFFKDDGTKFYIVGTTSDRVFQYTCSTAWDVSTASYDSKSLSVLAQDTSANDLCFGYYGTMIYIMGGTAFAGVYQYYLT
jgi:sugar lactone lactonase YvrE